MATGATPSTATDLGGQYLRHTKIPTLMFSGGGDVEKYVASQVAALIREKAEAGETAVLGLPTGSTPIGVYRELIRMHREEGLDFSNVVTFNLDEYWPIDPGALQSYNRFMAETFFDYVNVPEHNIHIPQGNLTRDEIDGYCDQYEEAIAEAGGIDIQLLGIGRSGHIGFNEPGSWRNSTTRLVTLDPTTVRDAADDFFGEENVPAQAITMGIGTILSARRVLIMALGEHKAPIVRRAVEGEVSEQVTASFLQTHQSATFVLDEAAAGELTAIRTPWEVGRVNWNSTTERRAVIWLSQICEKPLSMLEGDDFREHSLQDLVRERGPVEDIRQRVFDSLLSGITWHPAGTRVQKIIVFSPHPDDDVISMGGTLITLADQGHDVRIAYMTSGNIAVFDEDALRHVDYVSQFSASFGIDTPASHDLAETIISAIGTRIAGQPDADEVLQVKGLIRKTEATAAAATAGVPPDKLDFLDLPFYNTGKASKRPIGDDDVAIIAQLLRQHAPGQIYVAGDLSDPHGTHRMCAQAVLGALDAVREEGIEPEVWLYRGAWEEYEPHEISRAVPLTPETAYRKKLAIFKHESQKDQARFPGSDRREFWERAEARTRTTARVYNELGLPEYYALEAFARFHGQF
jgi:glucosamine-6-phosphate deaminase